VTIVTTRRATYFSVLLVLLIVVVYWPIRQAEFLNFDDGQYVNNNPNVFHGLTRAGFVWAFTTFHAANWHPLAWLSHMLDCQIFGDNPAGHHWTNVGFHAANSLLLFLWLWRTTRAFERSAFVAAIFALHPLHVESVAWIAERKDVLSGFFFMLVLITYGRYAENRAPTAEASQMKGAKTFNFRRRWVWYAVALALFACGLMAKPMLVTVPFLLMLLDVWPFQRVSFSRELFKRRALLKLMFEKIPFLLLSAGSAFLTFEAQSRGGAVAKFSIIPMSVRLLNAAESYVWYLVKTACPSGLGAYYSYPADLVWQPAVAAGLVIVAITAAAIWLGRRAPYALVGWLWYVGMLVPVIGLIQVGAQTRADRYSYLPMIGILILVTWGMSDLIARWRAQRVPFALAACAAVAACAVLSRSQVHYWKNSIVLFTRALEVSPERDFIAHHNLGHALSAQGKQEEAIPHFREALRIRPDYSVAHFNWGNAVGVQGKVEEAITHYQAAIRLNPDYEEAYYNLGKALVLTGDLAGGKTNLLEALRCKPDYSEALTALGNLYLLEGNPAEGLKCLQQGAKANPDLPEAHYFLGAALVRQGRIQEGVRAFRTAIKLQPKFADALNDLAWVLATVDDPRIRNATEALSLSRRACEADHYENPMHLDTLAVALSEVGQFDEAKERTRQAIRIAEDRHEPALVEKLRPRLPAYEQRRPYTSMP
jgi:tetratricopeptide (TPR) repeat protein